MTTTDAIEREVDDVHAPREFVAARARGAPWRELIRHLPRGVVDG